MGCWWREGGRAASRTALFAGMADKKSVDFEWQTFNNYFWIAFLYSKIDKSIGWPNRKCMICTANISLEASDWPAISAHRTVQHVHSKIITFSVHIGLGHSGIANPALASLQRPLQLQAG